jgi:hypothetical protein
MYFSVQNEKLPVQKTRSVFYIGSTNLSAGMGVCYDRDKALTGTGETAADAWGKRDKYVALPSATNNNSFAGVVMKAYTADSTNGIWIEIGEPGSVVPVLTVDSSTTIGETNFLWCIAGGTNAGKWTATPAGFMGKGAARVMQTLTAAGTCLAELMDGPESGLVQIVPTATLTAGGALTLQVGGVIYFDGPATPGSDCTATLANGTYIGQMVRFVLSGALTTNDVAITVTAGEQLDGTTDLATLEFDGDGDDSTLMFTGTKWKLVGNAGTGLA